MCIVLFFCLKFYCLRWDHCFSLFYFLWRNWCRFKLNMSRYENSREFKIWRQRTTTTRFSRRGMERDVVCRLHLLNVTVVFPAKTFVLDPVPLIAYNYSSNGSHSTVVFNLKFPRVSETTDTQWHAFPCFCLRKTVEQRSRRRFQRIVGWFTNV